MCFLPSWLPFFAEIILIRQFFCIHILNVWKSKQKSLSSNPIVNIFPQIRYVLHGIERRLITKIVVARSKLIVIVWLTLFFSLSNFDPQTRLHHFKFSNLIKNNQ